MSGSDRLDLHSQLFFCDRGRIAVQQQRLSLPQQQVGSATIYMEKSAGDLSDKHKNTLEALLVSVDHVLCI